MKNTNQLKSNKITSFSKKEGLVLDENEGRPTVIDLFAGCGGLSLGLYQAGWEVLFSKFFPWQENVLLKKSAIKCYEIGKECTISGKMRKVEVPRYTQIGNAIPPLFAELAGIVAKNYIQQTTSSMNTF